MEHGSAKWGNVSEICRRYCEKQYTNNLLLTQHFRMGLDGYKHKRNLNVLVVGGSGAGKSRTYAIPNIMQCNCSMVITDPKAELLRKTGGVLERNGYEVRVFDLINPETSWCYNPFAYVRDDKDVLKLINVVVKHFCNTLFENSPGISSFKWCFPIIVGMRTDMIVPYVHISV